MNTLLILECSVCNVLEKLERSNTNHTKCTQITLHDFAEIYHFNKNLILTGIGGSIFSELDKFGYLDPLS